MTIEISSTLVMGFVLAMARAGAWVAIAPPFGNRAVPTQVKVGLAAALSLALGPSVADQAVPMELAPLLGAVLLQVLAGTALGFVTYVLFSVFQAAGIAIDNFGGFAMAQSLDPMNGASASVFERLYQMMATTLLFVSGGHLLLVRGFLTSYEALPLSGYDAGRLSEVVLHDVGVLFVAGLEIAAPLLAANFVTEAALGLLSRAAPEMNVFLLGMPLKILMTLSLVGIAIPMLPGAVDRMTSLVVDHSLHLW